MGLINSIGNFLLGDNRAPAYQAPSFSLQRPQYQVDQNDPTDAMAGVFRERMGQPGWLPQGFEEALLGQTQRGVEEDTRLAQSRSNERLNQMNLLGSSAQGRAYGDIAAQGQRRMSDSRDQLTQARLGSYENTLALGQRVAAGLADRAAKRYTSEMDGYNLRMADHLRQYQSQVQDYEDRENRNRGVLSSLFGLGGAALGGR